MHNLTPEQVQHNREVHKNHKVDYDKLNASRARIRVLLDRHKNEPNNYHGGFDF